MGPITPFNCFVYPFQRITEDVWYSLLSDLIEQNELFIVDLNRQQLQRGIKADGSPVTPLYKPGYKKQGNPNLRDTGAYYRSFFVQVFRNAFDVDATDEKTAKLRAKYGDLINGLTIESQSKLTAQLLPTFAERLTTLIKQ